MKTAIVLLVEFRMSLSKQNPNFYFFLVSIVNFKADLKNIIQMLQFSISETMFGMFCGKIGSICKKRKKRKKEEREGQIVENLGCQSLRALDFFLQATGSH